MKRETLSICGRIALIGAMAAVVLWGQAVPGDGPESGVAEGGGMAPAGEVGRGPVRAAIGAEMADRLARLPLAFVENVGQWETEARFVARRGGMHAAFFTRCVTLSFHDRDGDRSHGTTVAMAFEGASTDARVTGANPLPGVNNYYLGSDASRWRTGVRRYRQVRYHDLYHGVHVRFRECGRNLEYDVELESGADLERVVIRCEGIQGLLLDRDGALVMNTAQGTIRQKPPTTWHVLPDGGHRAVTCRYRILDERRYGFVVANREPALAMVIDPGLEASTYLGGSQYDYTTDVVVDATGATTLCGYTESSNFPTTAGSYDRTFNGRMDAFVARFDSSCSKLLFSTFLGGSSADFAQALALTGTGEIVVTGFTQSSSFPTTSGAYSTRSPGGGDAFVTRLNSTGSALTFSTFLGGSGYDLPYDLVLGVADRVIVVGLTQSSDFPTTAGAYDRSFNGGDDAFVTGLNATGSQLDFSTFLGGAGKEPATTVALGASGDLTVAGDAFGTNNTSNFPTTPGAYRQTYNGGKADAYVVRLNATASTLVYSTFLGGNAYDAVRGISVGSNGAVTVAGQTYSANFPTTAGAYDTSYNGNGDVFVVRLDNTGSSLTFGTFVGGSDYDDGTALGVDSSGAATVAGWTRSTDYPTTPGAFQTAYQAEADGFVTRLKPAGDGLFYSTYFGGTRLDILNAMTLDPTNAATVAGEVWSKDFPTTPGAFWTSYQSWGDAFVSRLDLLPKGVTKYGRSTPACQGTIALGVTRMPADGAGDFAVTCINAPPNSIGILAVGFVPSVQGVPLANIVVHVNPLFPYLPLYALSDGNGAATVNLPVPAGTRGIKAYCQLIWANTPSCPGSGILSASNALEIEVQ